MFFVLWLFGQSNMYSMLFFAACCALLGQTALATIPMPDVSFFPLYNQARGNDSAIAKLFYFDRDSDLTNYCVDHELTKYGYLLNCSEWLAGVIKREKDVYRLKHTLQVKNYSLCEEKDAPTIVWGVTSGTCISQKWIRYLQNDARMFLVYITYTNIDCADHNSNIVPAELESRFVFLDYTVSKGGTWAENRNKLFMTIMKMEKTMQCLYHYHIYANNDVTPTTRPNVRMQTHNVENITRLHDIILKTQPFYSAPGDWGWHGPYNGFITPRCIGAHEDCDFYPTCLSSFNAFDGYGGVFSPKARQYLLPLEERNERMDVHMAQMFSMKLSTILFLDGALRICELLAEDSKDTEHTLYPVSMHSDKTMQTAYALLKRRFELIHNHNCVLSPAFPIGKDDITANRRAVRLDLQNIASYTARHSAEPFRVFNTFGRYGTCVSMS